ncbi:nitroreductase family protein [Candidatus Epulonipiscium viviparus]|uniref:nitroreductase family protein n=1 Tax=Candidatus Epulonipiscium viviparus TaxID=420336 RepID=UPI00016C0A36|nr:nitroreductase family protein [Candidatus Epulopiscium viviparus]
MNTIFTRRSVRQFKDTIVETEKVTQILKAAMQAPSAMNQQPWEFIVVTGRKNLDALQPFGQYTTPLSTATVAIVIVCPKDKLKVPGKWEQDLGAATQNLMLEACDLGLGSVWLGVTPDEPKVDFIQKLYNLPSEKVPYSVVALGYPAKENANVFVDRFDENKITYVK